MFNEFVNGRRKELGMSVDELVKISGIPKGTISKITAGINTNPTLTTVMAICKALNCSLNDAVGFETKPLNQPLTAKETKMLNFFRNFNDEGQEKALERLSEMSELDRYKKRADFEDERREA